jgi:hypothetical protein
MRLLNVKTRKLEEYLKSPPPYAVLSHRWGDEEASFQDVNSGWAPGGRKMASWSKVHACCLQAERDGLFYIWVDTCCINKESSRELDEAINSMFSWYKEAVTCYVYLHDVHSSNVPNILPFEFRASTWFTRGWTLQELLAPKEVHFFDADWKVIGTRRELSSIITEVTRIRRDVLMGWVDLKQASLAQRMSWAANRETTRIEDMAYCLLGLFDVNMDMRYGEGQQAFNRLQLEIMKTQGDHSILAWGFITKSDGPSHAPNYDMGGALANSPADFANSSNVIPCSEDYGQATDSFEFQGGSIRMQIPLIKNTSGQVFGLLNCYPQNDKDSLIGIPLCVISSDKSAGHYFRPPGGRPSLFPRNQKEKSNLLRWSRKKKLIYTHIRIKGGVQASESKSTAGRDCFYIDESAAMVKLIDVAPRDRWMKDMGKVAISSNIGTRTGEKIFLRFQSIQLLTDDDGDDFVIVLAFEPQATGHAMVMSRRGQLEELVAGFDEIRHIICGQQSCSNVRTGLTVTINQEIIGDQNELVLKLTRLTPNPSLLMQTVNATQQLDILRQRRQNAMISTNSLIGGHQITSSWGGMTGPEGSSQVSGLAGYSEQHAPPSRVDEIILGTSFGNLAVSTEIAKTYTRSNARLIVGIDFVGVINILTTTGQTILT